MELHLTVQLPGTPEQQAVIAESLERELRFVLTDPDSDDVYTTVENADIDVHVHEHDHAPTGGPIAAWRVITEKMLSTHAAATEYVIDVEGSTDSHWLEPVYQAELDALEAEG